MPVTRSQAKGHNPVPPNPVPPPEPPKPKRTAATKAASAPATKTKTKAAPPQTPKLSVVAAVKTRSTRAGPTFRRPAAATSSKADPSKVNSIANVVSSKPMPPTANSTATVVTSKAGPSTTTTASMYTATATSSKPPLPISKRAAKPKQTVVVAATVPVPMLVFPDGIDRERERRNLRKFAKKFGHEGPLHTRAVRVMEKALNFQDETVAELKGLLKTTVKYRNNPKEAFRQTPMIKQLLKPKPRGHIDEIFGTGIRITRSKLKIPAMKRILSPDTDSDSPVRLKVALPSTFTFVKKVIKRPNKKLKERDIEIPEDTTFNIFRENPAAGTTLSLAQPPAVDEVNAEEVKAVVPTKEVTDQDGDKTDEVNENAGLNVTKPGAGIKLPLAQSPVVEEVTGNAALNVTKPGAVFKLPLAPSSVVDEVIGNAALNVTKPGIGTKCPLAQSSAVDEVNGNAALNVTKPRAGIKLSLAPLPVVDEGNGHAVLKVTNPDPRTNLPLAELPVVDEMKTEEFEVAIPCEEVIDQDGNTVDEVNGSMALNVTNPSAEAKLPLAQSPALDEDDGHADLNLTNPGAGIMLPLAQSPVIDEVKTIEVEVVIPCEEVNDQDEDNMTEVKGHATLNVTNSDVGTTLELAHSPAVHEVKGHPALNVTMTIRYNEESEDIVPESHDERDVSEVGAYDITQYEDFDEEELRHRQYKVAPNWAINSHKLKKLLYVFGPHYVNDITDARMIPRSKPYILFPGAVPQRYKH